MNSTSLIGSLLGTAVGDALGLPYEGLTPQRATKLLGKPERHRFLFGHGMISDDTEHSCMVAQALIIAGVERHGSDQKAIERFKRNLAWRFRFWLLQLPAGVGSATARSIIKLWLGFSPDNSGVYSAGNGPAMRAAIIGAAIDDEATLCNVVRASTRITHSDPDAEYGALVVALAARIARRSEQVSSEQLLFQLEQLIDPSEARDRFIALIEQVGESVDRAESVTQFASSLGLSKGVTGYVCHTVPVALHAWLSHPGQFDKAIIEIIQCGGDADTVAAIVGGIIGAGVGKEGIPAGWLDHLWEWPRSVRWMERLALQLSQSVDGEKQRPLNPWRLFIVPRNLFFLIIVLLHGFRRLLPPF